MQKNMAKLDATDASIRDLTLKPGEVMFMMSIDTFYVFINQKDSKKTSTYLNNVQATKSPQPAILAFCLMSNS